MHRGPNSNCKYTFYSYKIDAFTLSEKKLVLSCLKKTAPPPPEKPNGLSLITK